MLFPILARVVVAYIVKLCELKETDTQSSIRFLMFNIFYKSIYRLVLSLVVGVFQFYREANLI